MEASDAAEINSIHIRWKQQLLPQKWKNLTHVKFSSPPYSFHDSLKLNNNVCATATNNQMLKTPTGKEEERAMFQQMQAMAQKQVNIEQLPWMFDFDLKSYLDDYETNWF